MKISIISDVHNNITNLQKVLSYCERNKIKKIICNGDLASMETLDYLADNFSGSIFYCFGNMDNEQMKNHDFKAKYKNIRIFRDYGEIRLKSLQSRKGLTFAKVAFVHYCDKAKKLCQTGKYDYVFYGHTHKPWEKMVGKCKMLNPGNVAGEIYPPTFCVWDTTTDNFNLILIHNLK